MTVVVTHTTPADSSFSSTGAAAWNADHALSGVGTMAEQNKTSVDIEGGTIDNTTVGATTPAAGTFTTLGVTTSINAAGAGANVNLPLVPKGTGIVSVVPSAGWIAGQVAEIDLGDNNSVLKNTYSTGITALSGYNTIQFATRSALTTQMQVSHTASAVNYVQVTGSATTLFPNISAQGSDTNIGLTFASKGSQSLRFNTNSTDQQFRITHTGSAVNYVQVTGNIAGSSPRVLAEGSDTNIDLSLVPKGTGNVRFGTYTASMALTVQGYIEIKDSGGTVRKLAVIA